MYIVTRRDIPPGYQGVQSCHAVAELMANQSRPKGWDDTMVWLSCADERELTDLYKKVDRQGLKPVRFLEPDIFHRMTAFAVFVPDDKYYMFSHLPLSLGKRKLSMVESFFMLRMACRNLVSILMGELKLKSARTAFDKRTRYEIEQFGGWMGQWMP